MRISNKGQQLAKKKKTEKKNANQVFVTYTHVYAGHLHSIYIFNIGMHEYISGDNQQVHSPHTQTEIA